MKNPRFREITLLTLMQGLLMVRDGAEVKLKFSDSKMSII